MICMSNEHKYKCPRCVMLTCSLGCSKEHKEKFQCSGVRDHVATLNVKMNDFTLGTLRRDLQFMDSSIKLSNTAKKKSMLEPAQGGTAIAKIPKKVKNLRYFLRKKRNIVYKHAPSSLFSRALLNTTYFDSQSQDKQVVWTLELIFYQRTLSATSSEIKPLSVLSGCTQQALIVMNSENMIPEDTSLGSIVSKSNLKKVFYN
jgi:hypothetical protein